MILLQVEEAMGEAEGAFRAIRKLNTTEDNNFVLDRSDSIAEKAMNSLGFLNYFSTVIGLITLIGAAIGLMNIMLVSVSERTKEVGLDKSDWRKKQNGAPAIFAGSGYHQCTGCIVRYYSGYIGGQFFFNGIEYRLCSSMELGVIWNH